MFVLDLTGDSVTSPTQLNNTITAEMKVITKQL